VRPERREQRAEAAAPGSPTAASRQTGRGRRGAACGLLPRDYCERYLSGLLRGGRSDRIAIRRVARQNCAVVQCMEERGLASCSQCAEAPCAFHEQLDRICPAGASPAQGHSWRLEALSPSPTAEEKPRRGRGRAQVPDRCIARLRWYLAALEHFREAGLEVVSSADIGAKVGVSSSLVRRDLCYFGQFGTPSLGYHADELAESLRSLFQGDDRRRVVWVGADRLLAESGLVSQFARHDWQIIAAFDPDPDRAGTPVGNLQVMHLSSLGHVVRNMEVNTAVLAVPEPEAQAAAEQLVSCGVDAILNLTAAPLALPSHVAVQQADLATQLMLLSYYARQGRQAEERR